MGYREVREVREVFSSYICTDFHTHNFCFFFFEKSRLIVRVGIFPDFPYFPETTMLKTAGTR